MAKGFAIHNAPTDHGGKIPATQMRTSQDGNLFVRAGDGHYCPKCKCWSTVTKSHDHIIIDGKPVAYVGDRLTCGARILPQQNHVVGESGSYYARTMSSSTFSPNKTNQNSSDNFVKEEYENYYIEKNTTAYKKFTPVLFPYDPDRMSPLGILGQVGSGAMEFIIHYTLKDRKLFVSVSYIARALKQEGSVYPFASIDVYRDGKFLGKKQLKLEPGYWDTSDGKEPVGSCTFELPPPDLSIVKVELILGYRFSISGSVGAVPPNPPTTTFSFSLTSAARRIK